MAFYFWGTMREEHESVGDLTFHLDDQVQTGQALLDAQSTEMRYTRGLWKTPGPPLTDLRTYTV